MATMNSGVLACSYAISGTGLSELAGKTSLVAVAPVTTGQKLPVIRAQQPKISSDSEESGRRAALLCLAATLFTTAAASSSSANAGVIEEYLEKSKANKVLVSTLLISHINMVLVFCKYMVVYSFDFSFPFVSFVGGLGVE